MEGFEAMRRFCERNKFGTPPVPAPLRPLIRAQPPGCWGTRELSWEQRYTLVPALANALGPAVDDFFSLSHVGHGVNSYQISYQLVQGPLVLFFQSPWGGVYMDNDANAGIVAERFRGAGALLDAVERARSRGWPARGRLVVMEASQDWSSRGLATWLEAPLEERSPAIDWVTGNSRRQPPGSALREALALIDDAPDMGTR